MKYKVGDKLVCIRNINNLIDYPLFIKDEIYEILDVSYDYVIINHISYGNEYGDFSIDFIDKNFKSIKQIRKEKLEKLNDGI